SPGERQIQLQVAYQAARTAQVVSGVRIARANGRTVVAAYRADTARVDVLDDGESLAAVCFPPVGHGVQGQREAASDGHVVLLLGAEHVVAQIHGGNIGAETRETALGWSQRAVACVFGPADV